MTQPISDFVEILRTVELFSDMPEDSIRDIALTLKTEIYKAGQPIIQKGDPGTCMYIVYSGRVYVHLEGHKVAEIGIKQTFGEFSLLNSEPRNASISALEDTNLLRLDQSDFYRIMANSPEVMRGIIRILIARLAEQNNELIDTLKKREAELTQKVEEQTREIRSAMLEIQKKNHDITESIRYAQTIQQSILPSKDFIDLSLPKSFILFKPREVVSGDFYWYTERKIQTENFVESISIIAAADCTGHGVPGALMSMIGSSLLNDIVIARGVYEPDEILNLLHKGIRRSLNQAMTENRDGMDIALCVIHKERKILKYAGAMNSLYYIQNNTLTEIKGDRRSIGGSQKEDQRIFTMHKIDITSPTSLYFTTDGYLDQFSGIDHKKFMAKRFKEYILEIHKKPMSEQRLLLDFNIKDWMDGCVQLDDILVIGIEVV